MSTYRSGLSTMFAVSVGCAVASGGCSDQLGHEREAAVKRPATLWVVLLDRSQSTTADGPIYQDAVTRVVKSVQPGDRFVMAAITGTSGSDFRISVDHSLADPMPPQGMLDEPKKYEQEKSDREKQISEARKLIESDAERFLRIEASAAKTAIFESLLVVAPTLRAEQRRRILVLLSDMLEDSSSTNFERTTPTDAFTKKRLIGSG